MCDTGYRLAVVGATGRLGSKVIELFANSQFPVTSLVGFASPQSAGQRVGGWTRELVAAPLEGMVVEDLDLVVNAAPIGEFDQWSARLTEFGAIVVNAASSEAETAEPLVAVDVNAECVSGSARSITIPRSTSIHVALLLKPLVSLSLTRVRVEARRIAAPQSDTVAGGAPVASMIGDEQAVPWQVHRLVADDFSFSYHAAPLAVSKSIATAISATVETEHGLSADTVRERLAEGAGVVIDAELDDRFDETGLGLRVARSGETVVTRVRDDDSLPGSVEVFSTAPAPVQGAAREVVRLAELLHQRRILRPS